MFILMWPSNVSAEADRGASEPTNAATTNTTVNREFFMGKNSDGNLNRRHDKNDRTARTARTNTISPREQPGRLCGSAEPFASPWPRHTGSQKNVSFSDGVVAVTRTLQKNRTSFR